MKPNPARFPATLIRPLTAGLAAAALTLGWLPAPADAATLAPTPPPAAEETGTVLGPATPTAEPAATASPTPAAVPTATAAQTATASPVATSPSSPTTLREAMAAAAGPGGAEMGQSIKGSKAARTESSPTTEGTWSPSFGVKGLDVSYYQSGVNWQTQWNLGARFAYIKATEGNYYTSPSFATQYKGARNAGMIRGAYHFANPLASSGADQARIFVQNGGGWSADGYTLPPVLDFEANPYAGQTIDGFYQGNSCYDRSPSQLASWVRDFGNTMKSLTGRLPVIYTNTSWWKQCTADATGFGSYPLWTAYWPSSASNYAGPLPASWSSFSLWQYSESGPFAGDSNVWNGDYEGLRRFAYNSGGSLSTPVDDFNGDGQNDLLSIRADGTLWFSPGNGRGGFAAAVRIGTGWKIYSRIVGVGDFNGDRRSDFVAIKPDGTMWFYAGTGTVGSTSQGYAPAVKIGTAEWAGYSQVTGVRDFNGDGRNDLVAARKDGTLWFFAGTGTVSATQSGYAPARKIGSGWNVYTKIVGVRNFGGKPTNDLVATRADGSLWFYDGTGRVTSASEGYAGAARLSSSGWSDAVDLLGTGDLTGDGRADLVALRRDNTLALYAGTGMNEAGYQPAVNIGRSSWNNFSTVETVQDFDGDGRPDLLAVTQNGALWFYASTGGNGYAPGRQIGTGWQIYTKLVGTGDINRDGKSDLLAVRPDGTLWFYAGTGDLSAGREGYAPARKVGTGWNVYSKLVATRDLDGDGNNDLAGIRPDGSLWFYHGTGKVTATDEGYAPAVKIGRSGWSSFHAVAGVEDFDGDGLNDLAGIRPDGTLWFYAGTGTVSAASQGYRAGVRIGNSGWNAYSALLGTGKLNADGNPDMVAVNKNGTLWFYAGAPQRNSGYLAAAAAGSLP